MRKLNGIGVAELTNGRVEEVNNQRTEEVNAGVYTLELGIQTETGSCSRIIWKYKYGL